MQIDQLFEFVYILLDKKQTTASEMAERIAIVSSVKALNNLAGNPLAKKS